MRSRAQKGGKRPVALTAAGELDHAAERNPRLHLCAAPTDRERITPCEPERAAVWKIRCAFEPREQTLVERHLHDHPTERPPVRDHLDGSRHGFGGCRADGTS